MTTSSLDPPGACRILALDCLTCPLATCLEDMMQQKRYTEHGMNELMAAFSAKWPVARVERAGRTAFVAAVNTWLMETVLPEARKVLAGKSKVLDREQARSLVGILE